MFVLYIVHVLVQSFLVFVAAAVCLGVGELFGPLLVSILHHALL